MLTLDFFYEPYFIDEIGIIKREASQHELNKKQPTRKAITKSSNKESKAD